LAGYNIANLLPISTRRQISHVARYFNDTQEMPTGNIGWL
jgi:hypothetical protein